MKNEKPLVLAEMILNSRHLAVEWIDAKAQNLITLSGILITILGAVIFGGFKLSITPFVLFCLNISEFMLLISLLLCLDVSRFKVYREYSDIDEQRTSIVSIKATYSLLSNQSLSNFILSYAEELINVSKKDMLGCYVHAIALNTKIIIDKARILNLAVILIQTSVILLFITLLLIGFRIM